jgi:hypothetical protein
MQRFGISSWGANQFNGLAIPRLRGVHLHCEVLQQIIVQDRVLIAALTRTPIREATKDDRAPNFRMADNPWGRCYGFGSGSDMRGT